MLPKHKYWSTVILTVLTLIFACVAVAGISTDLQIFSVGISFSKSGAYAAFGIVTLFLVVIAFFLAIWFLIRELEKCRWKYLYWVMFLAAGSSLISFAVAASDKLANYGYGFGFEVGTFVLCLLTAFMAINCAREEGQM